MLTPGTALLEPQAVELLRSYRIPYPAAELARSPEEAAEAAGRIGCPVVLKVVSPDVLHKSDVGGVVAGLGDAESVRQGYERMVGAVLEKVPHARLQGVLVCRQAPPGLEMIVGGLTDAMFGPTLMLGLGGIFTEVLKDASFRMAPVSGADAVEMVRELRGFPLLEGVRGQAGYDIQALVGILLSASRMLEEHPEILEMDLNPVRLYQQGGLVLDARVIVAAAS